MDVAELKQKVNELTLRIETYANLPRDNPTTDTFFNDLRKDARKLYEEIEEVPNISDRYHLLDHVIRGLMESGIIESVIKVFVDVFT